MSKRVTMADIAREAGVSLMTVSRVVNHKEGIGTDTRQRIQTIIDRLGYRPSVIARSLVTHHTGTVGLVVIDNANPFFSEVARGVEHAAYASGYNVFLCNTEEDPQRELAVLQSLEDKRVDGVIICSSRLDDRALRAAVESHSAVVLINRRIPALPVGAVLHDDVGGAQLAMTHLLGRGHQAVGFLAGPERSYSGQLRAQGYRAAVEGAGQVFDAARVRHCLPMVASGRDAAADLLRDQPELTALFCYNDLSAIGAMQACAILGRRVPQDVAIVGFDDIPLASLVTPALTTCRIPMYTLGQQAMRLLLAQINNCPETCGEIVIQPELVVRASAP